ncbi:29779_t:CDS:2, partial [Gigaspora margarita]
YAIRALTLEQGEELQERIDENFNGPLDDEQIPAALDFILEVLEYIITKGGEEIVYTKWSDVETKVKKVKRKAFRHYQRLAKKGHTYEMDDPYDASWYCRKDGKLEMVGKRRPQSNKTRRKVPTNYKKIISEMESEEFDQGKEEKVEVVYTEPREIVDGKALDQNYLRRTKEKEATYFEVNLPGTRTPVAAPKVLDKKEKEGGINNKENGYEELLQKVLNVCNALTGEIVKTKEETTGMNAALELEGLVLNEIKGFDSEILVKEGLEKDKNPMFESTEDLERSHGYEMDELDSLELYFQDRTEVGKDNFIREKDKTYRLESITETDHASCEVLEEFNQKKKKKMETVPTEPKEMADGEALEFLSGIIEKGSCPISRQDYTLKTREEEAKYFDLLAQTEGDRETFEERSVEEWHEDRYGRPLDGDALGHACDLWIKKVTKFRGMIKKKENNKPKEAPGIEITNEIIIVEIIYSADVSGVDEAIELYCRDKVKMGIGSMKNVDETNKVECCYWDRIGVNKAYEWCFEDTEDDNSASKFDPGGFWRRKLQLRRIKKETLEENNDNSDEEKDNKTKKFLKGEDLSLACERWNGRYQTGDKKSYNLPILDQEVIQNTEYAVSGECVMSEVGYINECVDIAKIVDNKIVNQLFDPGGSTFLKAKETALE